jgi:hypothetical protein
MIFTRGNSSWIYLGESKAFWPIIRMSLIIINAEEINRKEEEEKKNKKKQKTDRGYQAIYMPNVFVCDG